MTYFRLEIDSQYSQSSKITFKLIQRFEIVILICDGLYFNHMILTYAISSKQYFLNALASSLSLINLRTHRKCRPLLYWVFIECINIIKMQRKVIMQVCSLLFCLYIFFNTLLYFVKEIDYIRYHEKIGKYGMYTNKLFSFYF